MAAGRMRTCLWFDDQAEQAVEHYLSLFPDGRRGRVIRYSDAVAESAGKVMTVEFELMGELFIALNGGPQFQLNEAISFQIPCADQNDVDYYWSRLTDGGEEGPCGWLKDKFGVSWQVVPTVLMDFLNDPAPEKASRTAEAMFTMRKLDIAELERAHAGA